jgi:hypothetical protein
MYVNAGCGQIVEILVVKRMGLECLIVLFFKGMHWNWLTFRAVCGIASAPGGGCVVRAG